MVWFKNFNLLSYELLSQCSALQSLLSWALSFYFLHSELPWQQLPLILSFSLLIIRRVSFWLLKFSPFYLKTLIYLISNIHLPSVQISFETPAAWGERARAGARERASACAHARDCSALPNLLHHTPLSLPCFLLLCCRGKEEQEYKTILTPVLSLCCNCIQPHLKTDGVLSIGSCFIFVMDQPSKCWFCSAGAVGCFDGFFSRRDRYLPLKSSLLRVREPSGFLLSLCLHLRLSSPVMAFRGGPARKPLKAVPSIFSAHSLSDVLENIPNYRLIAIRCSKPVLIFSCLRI